MTTPVQRALETVEDIDYHLERWATPVKLASHLQQTHQVSVSAVDAANLVALLVEHNARHDTQRRQALDELRAAERAAGQRQHGAA